MRNNLIKIEIINEIPNNTNNEATPIMDDKQVTSEQSIVEIMNN